MAKICTMTAHDIRPEASDDVEGDRCSLEKELRSQRVEEFILDGFHSGAARSYHLGAEDRDLLLAFKGLDLSSSDVAGVSNPERPAERCGEVSGAEDSIEALDRDEQDEELPSFLPNQEQESDSNEVVMQTRVVQVSLL